MLTILQNEPAWENLTALAVVLLSFGLLLKWVLSTLSARLDSIVASLAELTKSNFRSTMRERCRPSEGEGEGDDP